MSALRCDVLTDLAELTEIEPEWVGLIQRGCLPSVFQHPGWVRAWWHSYGTGRRLLIMACREEQALVGVVPLMLDPRTKEVHFVGHPLNDRNGVVALANRHAEVWAAVIPAKWEEHAIRLSRKRRAGWRRDLRALRCIGATRFVCRSGACLAETDLADFHQDRIARWRHAGVRDTVVGDLSSSP